MFWEVNLSTLTIQDMSIQDQVKNSFICATCNSTHLQSIRSSNLRAIARAPTHGWKGHASKMRCMYTYYISTVYTGPESFSTSCCGSSKKVLKPKEKRVLLFTVLPPAVLWVFRCCSRYPLLKTPSPFPVYVTHWVTRSLCLGLSQRGKSKSI